MRQLDCCLKAQKPFPSQSYCLKVPQKKTPVIALGQQTPRTNHSSPHSWEELQSASFNTDTHRKVFDYNELQQVAKVTEDIIAAQRSPAEEQYPVQGESASVVHGDCHKGQEFHFRGTIVGMHQDDAAAP